MRVDLNIKCWVVIDPKPNKLNTMKDLVFECDGLIGIMELVARKGLENCQNPTLLTDEKQACDVAVARLVDLA